MSETGMRFRAVFTAELLIGWVVGLDLGSTATVLSSGQRGESVQAIDNRSRYELARSGVVGKQQSHQKEGHASAETTRDSHTEDVLIGNVEKCWYEESSMIDDGSFCRRLVSHSDRSRQRRCATKYGCKCDFVSH